MIRTKRKKARTTLKTLSQTILDTVSELVEQDQDLLLSGIRRDLKRGLKILVRKAIKKAR